ncbi:MAG: YgfZ/GcvT domain-containing protein [Gammaproteobacteria bacterium]
MKPAWKDFLTHNGAEIEDYSVTTFGNPERELRAAVGGNVICDLSQYGLISAVGDDVTTFLQGQLTNDVSAVSETHSQLAGYCTHKGRMLANFRLFRNGDMTYLRLPRELVETALARLRMFVLRSDVTLEDANDALVRVGLVGPDAEAELTAALGDAPEEVGDGVSTPNIQAIRVPGTEGRPRYEIYGELDAMTRLWEKLNVNCAPVGSEAWRLWEVLSGTPTVYEATSEAFVPQMANMGLLDGISFNKGCYTGQEVIARMEYLGALKRRLYLMRCDSGEGAPGQEVFRSDKGGSVGKVADAARHPDGGQALLAVIQISAEEAELHLGSQDGPELRIEPLPYEFDRAES